MIIMTKKAMRRSPLFICACVIAILITIVSIVDLNVQRGIGKSEWLIRMHFDQPLLAGDSLVLMNRLADESWSEYRVDIKSHSFEVEATISLTVYTETSAFSDSVKPDLTKAFVWVDTPRKLDLPFNGPLRLCNINVGSKHIIECSVCRTGSESSWVPRPSF